MNGWIDVCMYVCMCICNVMAVACRVQKAKALTLAALKKVQNIRKSKLFVVHLKQMNVVKYVHS